MAADHCCFIKYRFSLELMEKGRSSSSDAGKLSSLMVGRKDGMRISAVATIVQCTIAAAISVSR